MPFRLFSPCFSYVVILMLLPDHHISPHNGPCIFQGARNR
nr:MAG TPA: hypothetical protein [Caudoviricetes sp.]